MDNVKNKTEAADKKAASAELNIDLSSLAKKKVIVDGDKDRFIYLNTSDMNVLVRLNDKEKELISLQENAIKALAKGDGKDDEKSAKLVAEVLKDVDTKMRKLIDFIFDANVSEVCAGFGNMFDIINGEPRYIHILNAIIKLYESNITAETNRIEAKLSENQVVNKYVNNKSKKKKK